jgi:hypothetical protein
VSTFFSKNTLAIKAIEQRVKAMRVTNLLELHEPSWLSLNKLFKKFIVLVVVQRGVQVFHRNQMTPQELVLEQNYSLVQTPRVLSKAHYQTMMLEPKVVEVEE